MAAHNVIKDSGTVFEIVPNTRKIIVPQMYKVIGTVGDHLSEQLTIRCPKLIDGHSIANCNRRYVTWKNVTGGIGHDNLSLANTDGDYVYFTWVVSKGLTTSNGLVSFAVHFEDVVNDDITYRWSTAACTDCEILDSINGVLGAYQTIYVDGDTLVINDFVPVEGNVFALDNIGVVPTKTKVIEANGSYDVRDYANAVVNVPTMQPETPETPDTPGTDIVLETPTIKVYQDGVVESTANGMTATHQITDADAPTLLPENIAAGVTILGVKGVRDSLGNGGKYYTVPMHVANSTGSDIDMSFVRLTTNDVQLRTETVEYAYDTIYQLLNETSVVFHLANDGTPLVDPNNKDEYLNMRVWAYNWNPDTEQFTFEDISDMITYSDPWTVRFKMDENLFSQHFVADEHENYKLWVCYGKQFIPPPN